MKRILLSSLALVPALLLALSAMPASVMAAGPITSTACSGTGTVTCNLWAETGSLSLPGATATIWGYSSTSGGSPTIPGPALVATQGDTVTINLTNNLPQPTSLVIEGLNAAPDLTSVASGGSHAYTFTASAPGTYLYEAGIMPGSEYQAAMGLSGVLVVRPTTAGQAYGDPSTAYQDEALVFTSEIDPALNNRLVLGIPSPETFDLRNFAPKYFLVNGQPFTSATPAIQVTPGNTLLLRYANAGIQHHSLGVLGLHQRVIAADGSPLPAQRRMVAETLAPGQTADVLVSLPVTTAASTKYPIYDAAMLLNNSNLSLGIGGMIVMLDAVAAGGGTDTVGPITSSVAFTLATGALSASVSDVTTGGANVAAAEYFIDAVGANGLGTAMTGSFGSQTVAVDATISAATINALSSGTHAIYVHGQDSLGNWGSPAATTFVIDRTGPSVSALTLTPNPSNGSVTVALGGTASDAATGNNNVTAAEYFIGAPGANGSGIPLTRNTTAPTVSLSGTIPAQASSVVVNVHAQDAAGNWGAFTPINLTVDSAGPTTTGVAANPPANNGSTGQSSGGNSVRITASTSDAASGGANIAAGEGFIDTVGANGTGFPFSAVDGVLNSSSESIYADIPLSTINLLTSGSHTIHVHGKDAVGNWGATASISYLIDRIAPTFTGISLAPNPTLGAPAITLTVNGASDPAGPGGSSGVTGGEYWIDAATPPAAGTGTPFSGTSASIPTASLTTGTHTIGARIRDAAGNWSTSTFSASVLVVPDAIFSNGFETGGRPWGWSSASTNSTARLNVTTSPALVGTRSLQAQGNNINYVQYNFGTAAQPATATYDARFYFRPNGNTSTGQDILITATNTNFSAINQRARVRYRLNAGAPQVQIQVGSANTNTTWINLLGGTSNNVIEVVWQSGVSLQLYVNGTLSQTLTAGAGSITAVRLGSVTSGGSATLEYFDAFASKRTVSPLLGP